MNNPVDISKDDRAELLSWIQRYADGIADEQETLRLQARLADDAEERRLFLAYMEMDAALVDLSDAAAICNPESEELTESDKSWEESPAAPTTVPRPLGGFDFQGGYRPDGIQGRTSFARARWISLATLVVACSLLAVVGLWRISDRGGNSNTDNLAGWATVTEVGPGVAIMRGQQIRPARLGDALRADDQISVSKNGTARVSVAGLGVVNLGPEARFRSGPEPRLVMLQAGFAAVEAEKQGTGAPWRIRTPQVEAAVLATDFNIASAEGRTALRVAEGVVKLTSLKSGKSKSVHGGNRALASSGDQLEVATSRPGSVLLLTSRGPLDSHWDKFNQIMIEKLVNARIWRLGFPIEVQHYESVESAESLDLANRSLVILSLFDYGIGESVIQRIGLANADVPVICLEPAAYPALGMTNEQREGGFGFRTGTAFVKFLDTGHPLSGGFAGLQKNLIRGQIGWGRPVNEATRIAHLFGDPDKAVIFGYDTGQQMLRHPAPARRVGLFLDPTGIGQDSQADWAMFEAAVDWCVATGGAL